MPNMGFRGIYAAANSAIGGRIINNDLLPSIRGGFFPSLNFDYLVPSDQNFPYTSLLLKATGSNTQQNYTFLDSSTNAFTITRNGDVTQGSFSPYGIDEGKWSVYFDGTDDNLLLAYNSAFNLTGDFTIEAWIYPTIAGGMIINYGGGSNIAWASYELVWADGVYVNFAASSSNNGYDIGSESGTTGRIGAPTLNQWNHIAVTRSGNVYRGYLNGVLGYTQTLALTPYSNSTRGIAIGSNYATNWGTGTPTGVITGYVSNVRIVKGTAVYTTAFTPPTAPLSAISGTSLLTCQSNRFKDNSTNNFAIARNGDTKISAMTPFNQNNYYSASSYGGAAYFDGTGDYLSISTGMNVGTSDFTIEAWVYPTAFNTWQSIFSTRATASTGGATDVWALGVNTTGYPYIYSGDFQITGVANTVIRNTWTHLALSRSGSTMRMFVNGNLANTATSNQNYTQAPAAIGANRDGSEQWTGYISNLRLVTGSAVYTSAFTPPTAPVTAIANTSLLLNATNAGIIDAARKGAVYTHGQTKVNTSVYKYEKSIEFTGSSESVLTIPNSENFYLGNSDFTIETWVNLTAIQLDRAIITKGWQNTMPPFLIYTTTGDNSIRFASSSNEYSYDVVGSLVIGQYVSTGTWHHIAVTRSGNTFRSFFNGVNTANTTSSGIPHNAAGYPITIGGSNAKANLITGYIEDMRITRGYARYTANFTPPTSSLVTR